MIKSFATVFLLSAVAFFFTGSSSVAQTKGKSAKTKGLPPADSIPNQPIMVAIDAPPPAPPPLAASVSELKFGSQGIGVESCLQMTITNLSPAAQTLTQLLVEDQKRYSIPSPSHQMLPISIQPKSMLTISVCFKPEKASEYKTRLVIRTPEDSIVIPVSGKGIKPEDVGKLPKNNFSVVKSKKKKKEWLLKLQLISQCKITMQLFDELGVMKVTFWNGAFKNEGVYETPFEGLDKDKKKLPPGKYYVRCQIDDALHGNTVTRFTKVIAIK